MDTNGPGPDPDALPEPTGRRGAVGEPVAERSPLTEMLVAFSRFLNDGYPVDVSQESRLWRRTTKVGEEAGEVNAALRAFLGENPRKPVGPLSDVVKELADCASAAMGAIENLTGHRGASLDIVTDRVAEVCRRVGLAVPDT